MENKQQIKWQELLKEAVTVPGTIEAGFCNFYKYSFGNQIAALYQIKGRDLKLGPIDTYKGWQAKGRQVKKGEKAIALCMPIVKKNDEDETKNDVFFVWKNNWFTLAQTEGETIDINAGKPCDWNKQLALETLKIDEVAFDNLSGCLGYAKGRSFAVSDLCSNYYATMFHELAHIVIGHTDKETMQDIGILTRDIREVEAESVALICLEVLGLDGQSDCRGYIQDWLRSDSIPESSCKRIFSAADKIIKSGFETVKQ